MAPPTVQPTPGPARHRPRPRLPRPWVTRVGRRKLLFVMVAVGLALGLLLPLVLWTHLRADAAFRFASYIDDYMVLQKEPARAVIWGYGVSDASVTVTLSKEQEIVMKKVTRVKAHSDKWMVVLDPMKPGGPYEMMAQQTFQKNNLTVTVRDVLFGDVWLCSGQSNMQMTVSQIFNATLELANTAAYQSVRLLSVSLNQAQQELEDLTDVDLPWSKPSAENLGHGSFQYMSAVCWLFGRHLYDTLRYPVGLVSSSWGGTPIEAWSSGRSLKACGISKEGFVSPISISGPSELSVLWNAMIHPLQNMTLKGVIWYQGEANINFNRDLYSCTFPALIEDWRQTFHLGSQGQTERLFPFGFVQLSAILADEDDDRFSQIRWHQTADLGYAPNLMMPNTFMAVTIDLGDKTSPFGSIHPRDKQTVAYRLHLGARAVAYGEKTLTFQGPLPKNIQLLADKGLLSVTYSQPIEVQREDDAVFEISCCGDRQCKWLPAPMSTFSTQTLALNTSSCPGFVATLRYAWVPWPCEYKRCPLYHLSSALPAPPFIAFISNQMPGNQSKATK